MMRIRCACIYNNVVEVTTTAMIGKPIVCVPLSRRRRRRCVPIESGFVVMRVKILVTVHDDYTTTMKMMKKNLKKGEHTRI